MTFTRTCFFGLTARSTLWDLCHCERWLTIRGSSLEKSVNTSSELIMNLSSTISTVSSSYINSWLEYSFWPGAQKAVRLEVASEHPMEKSAEEYLRCLRKLFSLPIDYEQIAI